VRNEAPSGSEIADKAARIKLDNRKDINGEKNGKKVRFRGADLSQVKSLDELEAGQVFGVLETELTGEETTLPAGKHNLFVSKVEGQWRVYAEAGGQIVAVAARVSVTEHTPSSREAIRPRFSPEGWCLFEICLIEFWGFCILRIGFVCF
jgi:hypothetical protein